MKVHVDRNDLRRSVRVYFYSDDLEGRRIFYWPVSYEHGAWTWYQAVVPSPEHEDPRPALELDTQMWDVLVTALLESEHVRVDALDIVAATLKREQDRVDKLIDRLLTPMIMSTGPKQ